MVRRISLIILLLLLPTLLGGCWDRRELTELAIILGAGVDLTDDNQLLLTIQLAKPTSFVASTGSAAGATGRATWVLSAKGTTVAEAARNLQLQIPRRIYWAHAIILVIGEKLARQQGTNMVTDFFMRSTEPREVMWVFVTPGEARDILQTSPELNRSSAQSVGYLAKDRSSLSVNLAQFCEMLSAKEIQPVVTRVDIVDDKGEKTSVADTSSTSKEGSTGMDSGQSSEETPPTTINIKITGSAVFREDKLVGWLDDNETEGLLWLTGNQTNLGVVDVPSPRQPEKKVSFKIAGQTIKISPEYDGQNLRFDVKIRTTVDTIGQQCTENLSTPEIEKILQNEIAAAIQAQAAAALEKAQNEYGLDIFGFGYSFHRKYKRDWRQLENRWDQEFARASVTVNVEVKLRGVGLVIKPAGYKQNTEQ